MTNEPLAERLRPKSIEEYVGQAHILGENAPLRKIIESGSIPSMILWGPPGVGKTTIVNIISKMTNSNFFTLSAISSGVKDVREVISNAEKRNIFSSGRPVILFIDEIHRFNKAQQDSLLHAVEKGTIRLIGATTENPSFEVISPLLSRVQVYVLKSLDEKELDILIDRAIKKDEILKEKNIVIKERDALYRFSGGDARKLYNLIEILCSSDNDIVIDNKFVTDKLQENIALYDKDGEQHYDIISAFIKSVRGSDPDAAVYWLARMLDGGEDIKFIARRLIILASEDIGLANPNALLIANACFDAVSKIGMPEARIILSQATIYLSCSEKSNSAYLAIDQALETTKNTGNLPVPLHLRNAPTQLMKKLNYGTEYQYPHNFENNYVKQDYLPDKLKNSSFYKPGNNNKEQSLKKFLQIIKKT